MPVFTRSVSFWLEIVAILKEMASLSEPDQPKLLSSYFEKIDIVYSLLAAATLVVSRFLLERRFFYWLFSGYKIRTRNKISENLFYTIFYFTTFTIGIIATFHQDWKFNFWDNNETVLPFFTEFPPRINRSFHFFYLTQFGFYIGCLVFLLIDTRRSDFIQYITHHITTLILVSISFFFGYVRIGLYVLWIHDLGDIFLYGAKVIHYLGLEPGDVILFVCFMVTFFVTRLAMLPRIIWAITKDPFVLVHQRQPEVEFWGVYAEWYISHWVLFIGLLLVLQFLHCFWFCLILRMAYREVMGIQKISKDGDIRSNSDSD